MGGKYLLLDGAKETPIKLYFPVKGAVSFAEASKARLQAAAALPATSQRPDAPLIYFVDVTVTDDRYEGDIKGKKIRVSCADFYKDIDNERGVLELEPFEAGPGSDARDVSTLGTPAQEDFFAPSNNAVVRAFETTQGRGLAGMLTSISFNWLDENNTWEVTRGSRAPIFCTVTVGMNVIHDLPPGISDDGFMIAPSYPVGGVNRRIFGTPTSGPQEEYRVPIAAGNPDLEAIVKDPRVLDPTIPTAEDLARSALPSSTP